MATQHHSPYVVRFGVFEVDLQAQELRKRGLKIKIHEQPFQILSVLLERAGEVVTRDELRQRIWPADTFVDFDHSLSTGVNKLREALGDSADNPRFVETVPRRGYRFLGSVEQIGEAALGVSAGLLHQQKATASAAVLPGHVLRWYWINRLAGVALLLMLIGVAVWFRLAHPFSRPPTRPSTIFPLTGYGFEGAPAFSPDGNQVAFSWSPKQDNEDIYVKLIGTDNLLRLTTDPAADWNPAWSPDGRFIAFLRRLENEKHLVIVIPALGGPERKLAEISLTGSELVTHFVNWSPDSKYLIIVNRRVREEPTGLFVLSLETGEKRSLISPPAKSIGDSDPAFSPDGRTLAFLRSPSHTVHDLYLLALSEDLRPQGEPRRLTFDNGWISGAAWTPDGHEIVFSSDRQLNAPRLWRIVISGLAQPQPVALVGDDALAPAISRQGKRLAYAHARGNREIWQVQVPNPGDKASPPSKFIPSLFDHFSPQYSPDGKKVAFTSRRSGSCEIWVCEADGSNAMQLTSLGGPPSERASWSPDGKKIAFQSRPEGQAEIYVINSEGGRLKRLTYEPADDVAPSWSRDGRWIYFGSHRTGIDQVWKMPAEGGTPVQVTKNGGIAAVESPDGKFLYYSKVRGITGLWRMPVESGPETQVLESLLYLNFAVRPEGIYFSPATGPSIRPSLQILSFPSGKVKTIIQGETLGLEVRTLTVAPNGRSILYSRPGPEHSELMLVENFQ